MSLDAAKATIDRQLREGAESIDRANEIAELEKERDLLRATLREMDEALAESLRTIDRMRQNDLDREGENSRLHTLRANLAARRAER